MTEPNIVRSKRQRIEEGTAGSFFGPLSKRYGRCMLSFICVVMHQDPYISCSDPPIQHQD